MTDITVSGAVKRARGSLEAGRRKDPRLLHIASISSRAYGPRSKLYHAFAKPQPCRHLGPLKLRMNSWSNDGPEKLAP